MDYYTHCLLKFNRQIRKTNKVVGLCWIISDIGTIKGKIPLADDYEEKLFAMFVNLTYKAIKKVGKLSEQNIGNAKENTSFTG